MNRIHESLAEKIITIGPEYQDHRGGIGAVLSIYAQYFDKFKFIATYKYHDRNFIKVLFYLSQLGRLVKILSLDKTIEIVHIHGAQRGSFYRKFFAFLIAKKIFGKKVVYHMHSDCFDTFYQNSNIIQSRLIRYFVNKADMVICLAPYWKNFFQNNFQIQRLQILNNVILQPDFTNKSLDKAAISTVNFLFLGRIGKRKGIFDVMGVIIKHKDFFSKKMKLFIGGDGEVENLKQLIKENNLEEIVEYLGWVQGEQKNMLFSKADVYILPSYSEGLPISILEAMSFKLPVISTPVGGIPEIVEDNTNGKLVEPGNYEQIYSALQFFVERHEKIQEFGLASYQKVKRFFPDNVFDQLRKIYTNLLNEVSSEISVTN
jgi:glycosyltransferase involved in cell wall biosynthesis